MPDNTEWSSPEFVTIQGYGSGPAQDPFIAPSGSAIMLFDSHCDDPSIASLIYQASQYNYKTFTNPRLVQGVNFPGGQQTTPNLDSVGNIYWQSNAYYNQTHNTSYLARYSNGVASNGAPIAGISRNQDYWATMSAEGSPDGQLLLYSDFNVNLDGSPKSSKLVMATRQADGSFAKNLDSDSVLASINDVFTIIYNGLLASSGLELYFTVADPSVGTMRLWVAKRTVTTDVFDVPQRIAATANQQAENGSLSRDGKHLYYHQVLGTAGRSSRIYVLTRP